MKRHDFMRAELLDETPVFVEFHYNPAIPPCGYYEDYDPGAGMEIAITGAFRREIVRSNGQKGMKRCEELKISAEDYAYLETYITENYEEQL